MTTIGITGASGFVGRHLTKELIHRGFTVRAVVRSAGTSEVGAEEVPLGDFTMVSDWEPVLNGLDIVVNLAARVHVMHEIESEPLQAFRTMNVDVTRSVAQAAARANVKRFLYLSSIKVNGESTQSDKPFHASHQPAPEDPYGVSKLEAEITLKDIGAETGLEIAVVRPPLVYGPNVGGNFLRLLKLSTMGVPLPFGSVRNARAMIAVENLVDAIIHFSTTPIDGWVVALVKDSDSLSTGELLKLMGASSTKPSHILPFPVSVLSGGMRLLGKSAEADRLFGTLEIEISSDPEVQPWSPRFEARNTIKSTVDWYINSRETKS